MEHIIQLTKKILRNILCIGWVLLPLITLANCDQIQNGNFANGHQEWIAAVKVDQPDVSGSATFVNGNAYFKIQAVGEEKSFISLEQRGIHIQKGESYQIRFKAKAAVERPITVSISDIGGTYPTLSKSSKDFNLSTEMKVYEYAFNADVNDFTTRIIFMLGAQIGDVYIDDVSMEKLNCENCLPAGTPCDDYDSCTINDKEDGLCNCIGVLTHNNQIINGDFSGHFYDAWKRTIMKKDGSDIATLVTTGEAANFQIEEAGTSNWHIALEQRTLSIKAHKHYKISFKAKAAEARNINVKISDVGDGKFHITHFNQDVALTTDFLRYSFDFESPVTDEEVRIIFNMGLETPNVTIDDVYFEKYNCTPCNDYGKSCDDGNPCTINDKYDASCECVSYTTKEQYINNGNFSNQFTGWMKTIYEDSGTKATANFEEKIAHFKIENDGTKNWHISLEQRGIPFVVGETYAINFRAKAPIDRNINLKISDYPEASLTYFNQDIALTEAWQTYHYLYTPETTDNFTRIIFNMGIDELNTGRNEIFIDDVSISNIACSIYNPIHPQDSLVLLQFYEQSCTVDCDLDWTLSRPVHTWEGVEIENERVVAVKLADKGLSGRLPFLNLPALIELDLSYNNFKEELADFSNLTQLQNLDIRKNQFSFDAIKANLISNSNLHDFRYSPQYIGEEETYILQEGNNKNLVIDFFKETENLSFQWALNNEPIANASTQNYNIQNIQVEDVGIYTLHISNESLIPGFELISKPNYVFIDGYDMKGQAIYNNEVMVLFDTEEEQAIFAKKYLNPPYYGKVSFQCDCNRLLYLFQFTSSNQAAKVLLDIDRSRQTSEIEVEIEGDPNELIEIENLNTTEEFWKWPLLNNENLKDEVNIYILDSGLNRDNLMNTNFLMEEAPLICNEQNKAEGYSFVTNQSKISNQYVDSIGHGTYGFNAIANGKENNLKIVPIKIFDQSGKGSLFHFVCGLFHSIDNKADIINISAGFKKVNSSIVESALQLAQQKGIFITTAAGNDGINIDNSPQYPAYYAGQFYQQERLDWSGNTILDSIPYDNIISIAALNSHNELSNFSNFGNQSVTLSAYGENLLGYGIGGVETIYSGTSMATFFTTRELATEMAKDKSRTYLEIWKDFEQNYLIENEHTKGKTITGKQINVSLKGIQLKNNSVETNKTLSIFPNPSHGKVNIQLDCMDNFTNSNFNIKVFNILGVEVLSYQKPCAEHIQLDVSSLNKGTYLIEISGFSKSLYTKMILR